MDNVDQLLEWLNELVFRDHSSSNEVIHIIKRNDKELKVILYTIRNKYVIRTHETSRSDWNGYLGCQVFTRKPRAGEIHTRSRDLIDGEFSRELWDEIKNDIISYELVKIVDEQRKNIGEDEWARQQQ